MKIQLEQLEKAAKKRLRFIGSAHDDEGLVMGVANYACLEHLIHEFSHATMLGIPLSRRSLSRSVSNQLDKLPSWLKEQHEKHAWVVEYVVTQKFGMPITQKEIVEHAEIQNVLGDDMRAALRSRGWARDPAGQIIYEVERMLHPDWPDSSSSKKALIT